MRPMSAPTKRIISLMDNQEPVFGRTHQHFDPQLKDVYPHKGLAEPTISSSSPFFTNAFFYLEKEVNAFKLH